MKPGTEFNPYRAESVLYDRCLIMESPNPLDNFINDFLNSHPFNSRIKHNRQVMNNLLCNMLVAVKQNKVLALPRGSSAYSNSSFYGPDYFSHPAIIGVVDALSDYGYANYLNGFYNKKKQKGVVSRVWATPKLLEAIYQNTSLSIAADEESDEPCGVHYLFGQKLKRVRFKRPLHLKDESKKLIPYETTNKILKMQQHINQYNAFISHHTITIPISTISPNTSNSSLILVGLDGKVLYNMELDCAFYRVFNAAKFTLGGRFYGAEYQILSEDQRSFILIDGDETCEVDYSACHIRMLYNLEEIEYLADPYEIVNSEPAMRLYVKKMFQMLINANSVSKAIAAYRKYIDEQPLPKDFQNKLKYESSELAKLIMDKHCKIGKYFSTGIGRKLQYRDSRIAERILNHFTRKQIVCLCIHDSFIVKKQYQEELIVVMKREYKKEMGFDCELKINN